MNKNITFSIIKPDAIRENKTGSIITIINESGFEIAAMKMVSMTTKQAESFYSAHYGKPFFEGLIRFMTSGPVIVMILRHNNAVDKFRKLIGDTDPARAEKGTIRRRFAKSVQQNAIHGADSIQNAVREAGFFFSDVEWLP